MTILSFLLAACLDPVQAALVLAIVLAYRGSQPVMVSGVAAALITEAVMVLAVPDYAWKVSISPRIVSAIIQAAVLLGCVRGAGWSARRMAAWLRLADDRGSDDAASTAGPSVAVGMQDGDSRLAAWHMRGCTRRRVHKLRFRKIHAQRANQSTT